jgi:hypothetical protein
MRSTTKEASGLETKTSFNVLVLGLIIALGLAACSKQVSLCEEAMRLRANELGVPDKEQQKFVDICSSRATAHTVEQWECMISAMKKGTAYEQATEQCGLTERERPSGADS